MEHFKRKLLNTISLFIFLSFVFLVPNNSCAQNYKNEKILSFRSIINIHSDSTLTVSETIKVVSTGDQIKRGIYRDFPTSYKDKYGNNYVVGFNILEVNRNGSPEPYHVKNLSNGKRIYIGRKEYFLSPGVYTYKLVYETNRQLGFFEDHDELYWNVTGNGWNFPIVEATATIHLPSNANEKILSVNGFTGYYGSNGKSFEIIYDDSNDPSIITTRTLNPSEGLTIAISWPKGYVNPPSTLTKIRYFFNDNKSLLILIFCLFCLIYYYYAVWNLVGKDPKKGTIIPLYHPPKHFSPASMRYLWKMGYDNKTFTSAIINLAVKGFLKIEELDDPGFFNPHFAIEIVVCGITQPLSSINIVEG